MTREEFSAIVVLVILVAGVAAVLTYCASHGWFVTG